MSEKATITYFWLEDRIDFLCSLKNEFTSIMLNGKLRQERKSSYKVMVEDTWRTQHLRWVVDRREHVKKQEKQSIKVKSGTKRAKLWRRERNNIRRSRW